MTDELTPVRCGCGGEAKVEYWVGRWYVRCQNANCLISTKNCDTEAEAITAWNRAMSGATDTNVGDKERTAKVLNDGINYCENCEGYVEAPMAYCPYCGCRLEWK